MKAKDVRGFMVDKKEDCGCDKLHPHQASITGYNNCRIEMGMREITLNREKLINLIGEFNGTLNFEYHIKLADAIIAAEADIIESPENDNK